MSFAIFAAGMFAFTMGAINVGAGIERQRSVQEGKPFAVFVTWIFITIAGAISTTYQSEKNWLMYGFMSVGILFVTLGQAFQSIKRKKEEEKQSQLVKRAAGLLVLAEDRTVLIVDRKNSTRNGWAIPVSKCKPNEPAINAAYRALNSETGIKAVLLSHHPFISWEEDGYVVEVFAAIAQTHSTKNGAFFGNYRLLMTGAYPRFNGKMIEHFSSLMKL